MFRISKSALIDAPPDRVFACLADVRLHTNWCSSLDLKVAETSAGEPGVGYSGRLEGMYRDLPVTFRLEITEFTPYSRLAYRQSEVYTTRDFRGRGRAGVAALKSKESAYRISYELQPSGMGTRLTRSSEPAGQWWALPAYLVWPVIQPIRAFGQSQVLKMIKAELESSDN